MAEYDAIVVGGGPAGLMAARRLAEGGATTALLDPKAPWEKPCGGGFSPIALTLFPEIGQLRETAREVGRVLLTSAHGVETLLSGGDPYYVLSRLELAQALLRSALAAGAGHITERVVSFEREDSGWVVRHTGGIIRGGFLIGADGTSSLVRRRLLGPFERNDLGVAMGHYVRGCSMTEVRVRFERPEGYSYLFPRKDVASLGIGWRASAPGGRRRNARLLARAQAEWAAGAEVLGHYSHPFPTLVSREAWAQTRTGEGWALIGDAAGHVDPVRGEGLVYALWGASLLAEAVLSGRPGAYEEAWRGAFGPNLWRKPPKRWVLTTPGLMGTALLLARPFPKARAALYRRTQHHD